VLGGPCCVADHATDTSLYVLCSGQLRAALLEESGIKEAIMKNIAMAIACPEPDDMSHCDWSRVHLFFALSDEPLHPNCSQSEELGIGACIVENFVKFFPEEIVKGVYVAPSIQRAAGGGRF
jgi:hypothetical protein